MNILGLKVISHDTGAALIKGESIVAISEERLNRIKHSPHYFPKLSIDYCLKVQELSPKDIDMVVIDQTDLPSKFKMKEIFDRETSGAFSNSKIYVINHHLAHAASAFFCSPFDEAAILVYDGAGEKFVTHTGVLATETETLYFGSGNTLNQIQKTLHLRRGKIFPYTFGIGKLYTFISTIYLGLGQYNEGKMMGLAPYGNDSVLKMIPQEKWYTEKDGHILCNAQITFPNRKLTRRIAYIRNLIPFLKRRILVSVEPIRMIALSFGSNGLFERPRLFEKIRLPRPRRNEEDKLPDDYYSSVAYAAQFIFEKVAFLWGQKLKNITRSQNLCVAGGCGLNIDANMLFLEKVGFKRIFVQPACSDAGIPLGCALYGMHEIAKTPRFYEMKSASLGRKYKKDEIEMALEENKDKINFRKPQNLPNEVAKLIASKKIVGWFKGGSEYGPRALGNRSILCDPRDKDMKDVLNARVKHRESWRPFAASVLEDKASDFFEIKEKSPFMLLAAVVRKEKRTLIPSVVHVDNTCRVQTVSKEANGEYFELINEFYKETGIPLILNTSFNLGGEPIVESPLDALKSFLATNIDFLVLDEYLVSKK